MWAETSPVNAPSLLQETFWPAMAMLEPFTASTASGMAVNGGATTMSQCFAPATSGRNEEKNARVSASVLYIFQFPAITRRRMSRPPEKKEFNAEDTESTEKSGGHLSVRASTPGSLRPPRNSREAPPPVEMCEILPATPDWWTAATESPPPTMEVAPLVVAAATALATSRVPFAKAGISKTPMGPFQTMVLAEAIFWR